MRVEYLKNPADFIKPILDRVKKEYIVKTYKIESWESAEDFLEQVANKSGKLLKVCHAGFNFSLWVWCAIMTSVLNVGCGHYFFIKWMMRTNICSFIGVLHPGNI